MNGNQFHGSWLKKIKLSLEKKTFRAAAQETERVQKPIATYRQAIAKVAETDLIFLDEAGTHLNLALEYGRAPGCERVYDSKPVAKGTRISPIGALSEQGIETALRFEGTLTGAVFLFFVEHFWCPILTPGKVVVMGNASAHKVAGVVERIEEKKATVFYLPPYSPELNPMELAWSKMKRTWRKLKARTQEELYEAWSIVLTSISSHHAKPFFRQVRKLSAI